MSAFALVLLSLFVVPTEGCMMRSSEKNVLQLEWQAPADRQPQRKLVVRVDELQAADKGVLGSVENHPSLAHSMPNPIELHGTVIHQPAGAPVSRVALKYPKYKLDDAKVKDRLALGLVGNDVCICLAHVPNEVAESSLEEWLGRWTCKD